MTQYHHSRLVDLSLLRSGQWIDRVVLFFAMFGASQDGKHVPVWSPEHICHIIGWFNKKGKPQIESCRRTVNSLIEQGRLEKVLREIEGVEFYGYRPVLTETLSNEALALLTKRAGARFNTIFCKRDEAALLELEESLSDIPDLYLLKPKEVRQSWWKRYPDLIDFTDPFLTKFWAERVPNTLQNKRHPLSRIKDPIIRINCALWGFSKGVNVQHPGWRPDSPKGWMISMLQNNVGQKENWEPCDEEKMAGILSRIEHMPEGKRQKYPTLKDKARLLLKSYRGENIEDASDRE